MKQELRDIVCLLARRSSCGESEEMDTRSNFVEECGVCVEDVGALADVTTEQSMRPPTCPSSARLAVVRNTSLDVATMWAAEAQ